MKLSFTTSQAASPMHSLFGRNSSQTQAGYEIETKNDVQFSMWRILIFEYLNIDKKAQDHMQCS